MPSAATLEFDSQPDFWRPCVQDYVLLATRGPELAHSASQIAPLLGAETTVVTLQGGLPFWLCYGWAGRMENEPLAVVDPSGTNTTSNDFLGC